ncbi:MAG: glycosyltransferase [Pseudomonadales bacterium]
MSYRIAIVIDPWDHPFNGTVVSTRRFVTALVERGVEVRLLTLGAGSPADRWQRVAFEPLRIPGVNRIIDRMRSPLARPSRERLRRALDGCDLLHVQYPFFLGRAALREARRRGVPVVCSFHVQPENILSNLGLRGRWMTAAGYRVFRRLFFDAADRVVAPSEFAAGLLRAHGVRTPISVVSNGVPETFLSAGHALRPCPGGSLQVLSVGRLAREKQQQVLLEAVARSRHRPSIELHLAGAGPQQQNLEAQARRLGVAATIGPVDDATLLARYRNATLFVHCGGVELEGMSVLEAMATGNAVIVAASAASASPGLIVHPMGHFRPDDPADLAAKIDFWLDDADARAVEAAANRERAAGFRHSRCVSALLALYDEMIGAAPMAGAVSNRS